MNKQPPSNSSHDLLDAEERELAKVVRALPGGGPPAALDALILKAATDAVSSQSSKSASRAAKGFLGSSMLWLSTAAASILTVGIGWQVYQSIRAPINEIGIYESPDATSSKPAQEQAQNDSMVIEMQAPREPVPTSPPPPEAIANDAAAAVEPENARNRFADDAPAAPTKAVVAAEGLSRAMADKQKMEAKKAAPPAEDWVAPDPQSSMAADESSASAEMSAPPAAAATPAPAIVAAPAPTARNKDNRDGYAPPSNQELKEVTVTGSRIQRAETESASPVGKISQANAETQASATRRRVAVDSELAPFEWLNAIKKRRDDGDLIGAKTSLKKFQETYPRVRIPNELKPLLR
jgi:hypothetical protein